MLERRNGLGISAIPSPSGSRVNRPFSRGVKSRGGSTRGNPRGAERSAEGYYFCQQFWITRVFHVRVMCQESASILQMFSFEVFNKK